MRRFLAGIGSLLTLIVLLVGIPVALIALAGNPIPSTGTLGSLLTTPDYTGSFLVHTLLPIIGWVAWASFAFGFFVQLPASVRGIEPPHRGPLRLQRQGAAVLIGAILVMFAGGTAIAHPLEAHAAEPVAAVASTSSVSAAPTSQPAAQQEAAPQAATKTADPSLPTYTVHEGDSLWRIAEQHLGDGKRYTEIAQLNYGKQQADGHALSSDHWLNSGWVLTLPADAATPGVDDGAHTVTEGENLWQIAQQTLGDGDRYMELFNANQGKTQADGAALTDPAVLHAGWVLDIPTAAQPEAAADAAPAAAAQQPPAAAAPVTPAPEQTPAPQHEDAQPAPATPTPTPTPSTSPSAEPSAAAPAAESTQTATPAPAQAESQAQDADDDASFFDEVPVPIRTAGGIGGVLAAGLLAGLAARRMRQRRNRKPGERISMPSEEISTMELELRAVENPFGVEDVDKALRLLAVWAQDTGSTLPQLYAIRLAEEEIGLFLDAPADLPEPFTPVSEDKQAWVVDPTGLQELDRIPSAPYPALVAIGHDDTDAQILVDLEHLGSLNLDGDPEVAQQALTALAIELARSEWADDLTVTLVGVAAGLPDALGTSRIRHVDDTDTLLRNLRGQAADAERVMGELGVDSIEQARSVSRSEAWTPEIVILGQMPDQDVQDELAELVTRLPRVGIAAVAHGHLVGDWTLRIDDGDHATLQPIGLPLIPQTVSDEEYQQIIQLLGATEQPAVPGPAWTENLDRDEIRIDDLPEPEATAVTVQDMLDEPDPEQAWKQELHQVLRPASAPAPAAAEDDVDELEDDVDEVTVEQPAADPEAHPALARLRSNPYVQVLGDVQVIGARGNEPQTNGYSNVAPATELIAYLALHPGKNTAEKVTAALWPNKPTTGDRAEGRRNRLMSQARSWLGNDDNGDRYIPRVTRDDYRVENVATDYDVFLELVGTDISATPTEDLVAALHLVKDVPFSGLKRGRYEWNGGSEQLEIDRKRSEAIATIGDVTHEVAVRALKARNFPQARVAAAVGRQVDPINELFWRDAILAEYQAGNQPGVDRVWNQLTEYLDSFTDDYEPADETVELIQQIREHQSQGAA